jgi:hypothetical protein
VEVVGLGRVVVGATLVVVVLGWVEVVAGAPVVVVIDGAAASGGGVMLHATISAMARSAGLGEVTLRRRCLRLWGSVRENLQYGSVAVNNVE